MLPFTNFVAKCYAWAVSAEPYKVVDDVQFYVVTNKWARKKLLQHDVVAFAIGESVFLRAKRCYSAEIKYHELAHVQQARDDSLFEFKYYLQYLRHGYWNNAYEKAARKAAKKRGR